MLFYSFKFIYNDAIIMSKCPCNVPVRSAVLHAYLNPFVHTRTMSPEDTILDYYILKCCST